MYIGDRYELWPSDSLGFRDEPVTSPMVQRLTRSIKEQITNLMVHRGSEFREEPMTSG